MKKLSFLVFLIPGLALADASAGLPVLAQANSVLGSVAASPLLVLGGPIVFELLAKLWPSVNPQGMFLIAGSVLGKAGAIITQLGEVVSSLDDVIAKAIPHNLVAPKAV